MSETSLSYLLVSNGVASDVTLYKVDNTKTSDANVKAIGQDLIAAYGADSVKSVDLKNETSTKLNINFD